MTDPPHFVAIVYSVATLSAIVANLYPDLRAHAKAWRRRRVRRAATASSIPDVHYRQNAAPPVVPTRRTRPNRWRVIRHPTCVAFAVAAIGHLVGLDILRSHPVLVLLWAAAFGWITGSSVGGFRALREDLLPEPAAAPEAPMLPLPRARSHAPRPALPSHALLVSGVVLAAAAYCAAVLRASKTSSPGDPDAR